MPIIQSSILVSRPASEIYGFLKNLDAFSKHIAGVEQIKVRRLSQKQVVSEWAIKIDGTPLRWRERDTFEDDLMTIKFKMIDGDFATYGGEWRVLENGSVSRVTLAVSVDLGLVNVGSDVTSALERKARLAIRWMLRHLRKALGPDAVLSQTSSSTDACAIISELVSFRNQTGQTILAYYDHLGGDDSKGKPFLIIPPGYGETKRDAITIAYYLAKNGFQIIRYDATNHVGESDGDVINTTLGQLKNDLIAAIDYTQEILGAHRVGVVASSLAKRIAIKAAAEDKRIAFLISLVGVVDLRTTLQLVYKEDMIGSCLQGKQWGITDVLGLEVSGRFLESAISEKYHDLETTKDDLRQLDIPVVFFLAENDVWVQLDQVKLVIEGMTHSPTEIHIIPEALHRLEENPRAARTTMKQIVASCSKYLLYKPVSTDDVLEPSLRDMATQNKIEKERLKNLRKVSKSEERAFWKDYLAKYFILIKSPDYRLYLEDICESLGPFISSDTILDAGCGNGHLGAWLLSTYLKHPDILQTKIPHNYIGLDFSESAVKDAKARHSEILNFLPIGKELNYQYILSDLNSPLPFPDESFTKICSSLVISYLDSPQYVLKELLRVLKPDGKIVVSTLKPQNDLSLIYRNFVDVAQSESELQEGRRLLSNAGKIRQKEREGHYLFFSKTELIALLASVEASSIQCRTSFGNQAYIATANKPRR